MVGRGKFNAAVVCMCLDFYRNNFEFAEMEGMNSR